MHCKHTVCGIGRGDSAMRLLGRVPAPPRQAEVRTPGHSGTFAGQRQLGQGHSGDTLPTPAAEVSPSVSKVSAAKNGLTSGSVPVSQVSPALPGSGQSGGMSGLNTGEVRRVPLAMNGSTCQGYSALTFPAPTISSPGDAPSAYRLGLPVPTGCPVRMESTEAAARR
jgi:hypothetical protein